MIKTTIKGTDILKHQTPCLIFLCREEKKPSGILRTVDKELNGALSSCYEDKRFEGKPNQKLWLNAMGALKAENILLVGAGKTKGMTEDRLRQAAGSAARRAEGNKCKKISIAPPDWEPKLPKGSDAVARDRAIVEGIYLSLYHFDNYKTPEKDAEPSRVEEIVLLSPSKRHIPIMKKAVDQAGKLCEAVKTTRDLISHPGNTATPTYLAETARQLARKGRFSCKVLGVKEMEKLGMGALLGVARGSHQPPRVHHHGILRREKEAGARGDRWEGRHFRHRRHIAETRRGYG